MPSYARFTTTWTITWAEFEDIQRKKISKIILPSYKNVVFRLRLEFSCSMERNDAEKIGMSVFYEDGPLFSMGECWISYNPRNVKEDSYEWKSYQVNRGEGKHWPNFEDKDVNVVKNEYGLDASEDIRYSITITIPLRAFNYKIPKPVIEQPRGWLTGIFECLKDVEKADFSDVRFVAGDNGAFYCHQVIVGRQSKELETMLKNPKSEGERFRIFCFPSLDTSSLNAILKYLYTGEYNLAIELPMPSIIQLADFSEQYGLKVLKEACIAQLWDIVVTNPKDAMEILRFADLHPDTKYLKDRAMNVIMENFEKLSLKLSDFSGGDDKDLQGNRLREEYTLYMMRRLWIWKLW